MAKLGLVVTLRTLLDRLHLMVLGLLVLKVLESFVVLELDLASSVVMAKLRLMEKVLPVLLVEIECKEILTYLLMLLPLLTMNMPTHLPLPILLLLLTMILLTYLLLLSMNLLLPILLLLLTMNLHLPMYLLLPTMLPPAMLLMYLIIIPSPQDHTKPSY